MPLLLMGDALNEIKKTESKDEWHCRKTRGLAGLSPQIVPRLTDLQFCWVWNAWGVNCNKQWKEWSVNERNWNCTFLGAAEALSNPLTSRQFWLHFLWSLLNHGDAMMMHKGTMVLLVLRVSKPFLWVTFFIWEFCDDGRRHNGILIRVDTNWDIIFCLVYGVGKVT